MKKAKNKLLSISLMLLLVVGGILAPQSLYPAYAGGGFSGSFKFWNGGSSSSSSSASSNTAAQPQSFQTTMAVHFIDVGQGLSILVQSGGQNLLYDGGDQEHADNVVSYLQQQNVQNIDYMISSHYDEDHVSGLIDCMNTFPVSNVIGADYAQDSDVFTEFMDTAATKGLEVRYPFVGDSYSFGTGSFTILAPDGINAADSNNNSVVIKLENGSTSFIFTGDAEEKSEQDMIKPDVNLDCDVLCVGHHGSSSSTSWDFLEATTPEYAVISCGIDNQYGHPSEETLGRLSDMGIPVFRTDKQGTIIAQSDGSSIIWNVSPYSEEASQGISSGTTSETSSSTSGSAGIVNTTPEPTTNSATVWLSATGSKYHRIPDCGNMNPDNARQVSQSEAQAQGYTACSKCF